MEAFQSLCMSHLGNLEALRQTLSSEPKLKPDRAKYFVEGPGDAWQIPDRRGNYVLVILTGKPVCQVHAQGGDIPLAEKLFQEAMNVPTLPWVSHELRNDASKPTHSGRRTIVSEWRATGRPYGMVFALTTDPSSDSVRQLFAQAAVVR